MRHLDFRKSSFSGDAGQCVEIARDADKVYIRDSKSPSGPVLVFSEDEWKAFVQGVKAGEFSGRRPDR